MNKAESFIENHTLPVLISLMLIIACCFAAVFFIKPSAHADRHQPDDIFISDENDNRLSYNIRGENEARQFAEIYLNNTFPLCAEHECHCLQCGSGYMIYRGSVNNAFDSYYNLSPAVSVTQSGTVNLHIHRILNELTN